jgi:alkane 1-monooxygenase
VDFSPDGATDIGGCVRNDAREVPMLALRFAVPFLFLASAPVGFALGGAWAWLTPTLTPLALAGFGWALGVESGEASRGGWLCHRALLWLYIVAQIGVIVWAAAAIGSPRADLLAVVGLTVSVGTTAGIFGIVAAHEMVHSPRKAERGLALGLFACLGYMHFRIAHLHGHHVRGATFEDPASARFGESVYHFLVRSIVGQVGEAWTFEAKRLRRRGRPVLGLGNRLIVYLLIELLILAGVALLGWRALGFWIGEAAVAILLLELFNYIAHYGLQRRRDARGIYERMSAQHSWNSRCRMNNWSLFNMGRHSDHHRRPSQAYQRLVALPRAPQLPGGYAEAILLSLVPPLWRRVMDPRVEHWMDAGESARVREAA